MLDRCFAKEPAGRLADLAALADALWPWGSGEIVERIRAVLQPPRRRWKLAVPAIVLGFGIGALVWPTR